MALCHQRRKFYAGLLAELTAWARHQFELDVPDKGGTPAREHLAGALKRARTEERRRALAAELAGPPFPQPLRYLWLMWVEVADGLESGGWGVPVVTWQSLDAWSRLTGVTIAPCEALALVRIGAIRAAVVSTSRDD